jgi:hypothetical protein
MCVGAPLGISAIAKAVVFDISLGSWMRVYG